MSYGVHVVGAVYGVEFDKLDKVDVVRKFLIDTVKTSNLSYLSDKFHQFEPHGVTGVILLAESHISIHTWPEDGFAAIDIFTCGPKADAVEAFDLLTKKLEPERVEKQVIVR